MYVAREGAIDPLRRAMTSIREDHRMLQRCDEKYGRQKREVRSLGDDLVRRIGFQMLVGSEGQVIGLPLTILGTVAASGVVYLGALLLAWRLESYPRGPEQEIIGLFRKLRVLRLRRA